MAMRYYAPFPGGGGNPYRPPGLHALRIGDAERDAAAADLGEHYAAGRLTLDELNERLAAVFAARTYGQLTQIMTDLPGRLRLPYSGAALSAVPPGWPPYPPLRTRPRPRPTPADRAGRIAALSLLLLAMLIWLFTALLFARHGVYQGGPGGQLTHTLPYRAPMGPGGPMVGHGIHLQPQP